MWHSCADLIIFISADSKSSRPSKDGSKDDPDMTNTPKPDISRENSGATSQGSPPKMTSLPQQIITSSIIVFTTDFTTRRRETSSSSTITSNDIFTEPVSISSVKSTESITTLDSTSITPNSFGFSLVTSTAMKEDTKSFSSLDYSQSDSTGLMSSEPQSSHENTHTSDTSFAVSEESTFTAVDLSRESSTTEETTSSISVVSLSSNSGFSFTPSIADDDSSSSQRASSSLVVTSSTQSVESSISSSSNSNSIKTQAPVATTTSSFSSIGTEETIFETSVHDSLSQSFLLSFNSMWSSITSESSFNIPETSSFSPIGETSLEIFDSSSQQTETSDVSKLTLDISSDYLTTSTIDVSDASTSDKESSSASSSPQILDSFSSESNVSEGASSSPSDIELTTSTQDETSKYSTLFSYLSETVGDTSTIHVSPTDRPNMISVSSSMDTSNDEILHESSTYNSEPMIATTMTSSSEPQDRTNISYDDLDTASYPKPEQTSFQTEDESINSMIPTSLTIGRNKSTVGDTTILSSSTPENEVITPTNDEYNTTISPLSEVGGSGIISYTFLTDDFSGDTEKTTADTMTSPSTDDYGNIMTVSFSSDFNNNTVMLLSSSLSATTDVQSAVIMLSTTATFSNFDKMILSTANENGSSIVELSSSAESYNTNETLSTATISDDGNVTHILSTDTNEANNSVVFAFSTTENGSTIISTIPDVSDDSTTTISPLTTIDNNDTYNTFFTTEENASTITVFPSTTQIDNNNNTVTFVTTGSFDDNTSMTSPTIETYSYNMTINSETEDISSSLVFSFMTALSYNGRATVSSDDGNFTFPSTFDTSSIDDVMMLSTTSESDNNTLIPSTTTVIDNNIQHSSYNSETMDYSVTNSYYETAVSYTVNQNETSSDAFPFTRYIPDNNNTKLFPSETEFDSNINLDMVSTTGTIEDNINSTLFPSTSNYYVNTTIIPTATNTEGNITFINSFSTELGDNNNTDFEKETNSTISPSDSLSNQENSTMVDFFVDDSDTTESASLTYTLNSNYTTLELLTDVHGKDSMSPTDKQIRSSIQSPSQTESDQDNNTNISGSNSDTLTIS